MNQQQRQPRGIRNNNPANIRWGDNWQGLDKDGKKKDPSFCVFVHSKWGIRALCKVLMTYYNRHGLETVRGIINRFAPPVENNTSAYVNHVAELLGVGVDDKINVLDTNVMFLLIIAIIRHENGQCPYTDAEIRGGMLLAGMS